MIVSGIVPFGRSISFTDVIHLGVNVPFLLAFEATGVACFERLARRRWFSGPYILA